MIFNEMTNSEIENKYGGHIEKLDDKKYIVRRISDNKCIIVKRSGLPVIDKWFDKILGCSPIGRYYAYSNSDYHYIAGITGDQSEIYDLDTMILITTLDIDISELNERNAHTVGDDYMMLGKDDKIYSLKERKYIFSPPKNIWIRNICKMNNGMIIGSGTNRSMGNYDAAINLKTNEMIFCKEHFSYPAMFSDGVIVFSTYEPIKYHLVIIRGKSIINIPLEYCNITSASVKGYSSDSYEGKGEYSFNSQYGEIIYNATTGKWKNSNIVVKLILDHGDE